MKSKATDLISILVPVYNGENYLREALESIIRQTHTNFECLVVDDGSKNSRYVQNVVNHLCDERFKFFRQENAGVASALNRGVSEAKGSYITWLSHDDLWTANKLELQLSFAKEDTILFSNYKLIDEAGELIATTQFEKTFDVSDESMLLTRGLIHGCTAFIPREVFFKVGKFNEELLYTQDYDFWLRAIEKEISFEFIAEPTTIGRVHPNQTGKTANVRLENNALWRRIIDYWLKDEFDKKTNKKELLSKTSDFRKWAWQSKLYHAYDYIGLIELEILSDQKVSVIIPHFDRVHQVLHAIKSCLSQTHYNIEVLVVDDSKDSFRLEEQIRGTLSKQENTKVFFHQNFKKGVSSARNLGLQNASGEYIAFLDSDDYFTVDKIEVQLKQMLMSEALFSHTNYLSQDLDSKKDAIVNTAHNSGESILLSMSTNCAIATPTVMLVNHFGMRNLFNEEMNVGEDVDAWMHYIHKYGNRNTHVDRVLTIVRTSGDSAKNNPDNVEKAVANSKENYAKMRSKGSITRIKYRQKLITLLLFFWRISGRPSAIRNNPHLRSIFWRIRGY